MTTSPVSDLQVLITARAIISSPEHWTQGAYARSKERIECDVDDGESFCSIGAIKRAIGVHDMILRVFDRAIENLSANGGNNDR